jgi:hypothetical protein
MDFMHVLRIKGEMTHKASYPTRGVIRILRYHLALTYDASTSSVIFYMNGVQRGGHIYSRTPASFGPLTTAYVSR